MGSKKPSETARVLQEQARNLKSVTDQVTLVIVSRSDETPGLYGAHFTITGDVPRVITAPKSVIAEIIAQIGFDTLDGAERRIDHISHDSSITFQ